MSIREHLPLFIYLLAINYCTITINKIGCDIIDRQRQPSSDSFIKLFYEIYNYIAYIYIYIYIYCKIPYIYIYDLPGEGIVGRR